MMDERTLYEQTYLAHYNSILKYCIKMTRSDRATAEAITGEVFRLLWVKWNTVQHFEEKVRLTWIYHTAYHKIQEYWREVARQPLLRSEEEMEGEREVLPPLEERDQEARIRQIRKNLTYAEWEVFDCRINKQLSPEETAERLEISRAAVDMRWSRAKKKIRRLDGIYLKQKNKL